MKFKKILMFMIVMVVTVVLVACNDDKDEGITVTDMAGAQVVVPKNITKVAAVSPSTADLMIAFGLGDKIDGVYKTVTDNEWATLIYPDSVNFYKYEYDESAESYFSRGVDLILLPDPTTVESLRNSGLTVLNIRQFASGTFDDYLFTFSEILRQIFPEASDKIDEWQNRMNTAMDDIASVLEAQSNQPSLYYIYGDKLNGRGSHLAYTDMPNSFVASLLRKLNVKFVSDNFTSNRPSEEEVLDTNPDIILIGGNKYLEMEINNFKFYLTPFAFFQLNTNQAEKLYNIVIEKGSFKKDDLVLDAYSGVGTIATHISPYVKKVVAIESIKDAVNDMNYSLKVNKISNVKTITGDFCKQRILDLIYNT